MKITSAQNPLIKSIHKISTQKKERKHTGLTILDGFHLLEAYLKFGNTPQEIIVSQSWLKNPESEILKDLNYNEIPDSLLQKIAPTRTPAGILSLIPIPKDSFAKQNPQKALLLDQLQDPGNVGTIIRSAVAAGFDHIFSLKSAELWSPKALRAAQGAHFYPIHLLEISDLSSIPNLNWYALSCDKDAENLFTTKLETPLGFMIGNEGAGLSKAVESLDPKPIHIPMAHEFESLNAAICASICMFQA